MTEQHIAPASANLEYNANPDSSGVCARVVCTMASNFEEPVDDEGAVDMMSER